MHRLWRLRARLPGVGHLSARRSAGKMEGIYRDQREVLRAVVFSVEGSWRVHLHSRWMPFCCELQATSFEYPVQDRSRIAEPLGLSLGFGWLAARSSQPNLNFPS